MKKAMFLVALVSAILFTSSPVGADVGVQLKAIGALFSVPAAKFSLGFAYVGGSVWIKPLKLGIQLFGGGKLDIGSGSLVPLLSVRAVTTPHKRVFLLAMLDVYFEGTGPSLYFETFATFSVCEWFGVGVQYEQADTAWFRPGVHAKIFIGKYVTLSAEYMYHATLTGEGSGHVVRSSMFVFF